MPATIRLVADTSLGAGLTKREVQRRLHEIMAALKLDGVELSVVLTGDDQIQELNRLYRKKDRPTDVLAFAMNEGEVMRGSTPPEAPRLIGDVIVSIPTARLQAKQAKRAVLEEVTMLLAHGVLHLLGWDHETAKEDRAMRAEVDRLCAAARRRHKPATRHVQRRHKRSRKLS